MMTLNPQCFWSSKSHKHNNYQNTKQHTKFPSTTSLFTCLQAKSGFAWNPHPQKHSVKGVFQNHPLASGVNISNNISIPQVRVNISKTEHGTTFEISINLENNFFHNFIELSRVTLQVSIYSIVIRNGKIV